MMRAATLSQWKQAMRIRALVTSTYTYADGDSPRRQGKLFARKWTETDRLRGDL